jgi:peptide deformylase
MGLVKRPKNIQVSYLNRHGKKFELNLTGFPARVFQHEMQHLDGGLYMDDVETSLIYKCVQANLAQPPGLPAVLTVDAEVEKRFAKP